MMISIVRWSIDRSTRGGFVPRSILRHGNHDVPGELQLQADGGNGVLVSLDDEHCALSDLEKFVLLQGRGLR